LISNKIFESWLVLPVCFSITTFNSNVTASAVLSQVSQSCNFASDAAAATGGIPLGGLYHTAGTIKIRLS
jgi:hypothetical protein